MMGLRFNQSTLIGLGMLALGVGMSLVLRDQPGFNAGPLILAPGILLLGFSAGTLVAWGAGVAAGVFTVALQVGAGVSLDLALAALAGQLVCTLFPLPFVENSEAEEAEFHERRRPLDSEREGLRETLEELRQRAQAAERRGRETDALYHAGREISKLLTLEDTLEFSREVLRDTLRLSGGEAQLAFVLALADDEGGGFRVGAAEGLEKGELRHFEQAPDEKGLMHWLEGKQGPVLVPRTAAEPGLKGVPLPPALRGLLALPLLIQDQAIGWVLVLDLGGAQLEARDFSNLRILCSQIAIGLEKATLYDRLQRLSITDGLTGLYVHRYFQSRLEDEVKRAERYKEPLSLLMFDIDHFKRFNDEHGHLGGDAVLKAVAGVLREGLSQAEVAARYGGEEFTLILPRAEKQAALGRAEALRQAVKALKVEHDGKVLGVTISLGVASYPADAMTKKGLIEAADGALYASKSGGRDRVSAAAALDKKAEAGPE
jgi:diguanylate cyclase (GGDEF)-like protein